jgi:GGDEF domain-containing protein
MPRGIKSARLSADIADMPAALPGRRLLLIAAMVTYMAVFAAALAFERPGLALSRFFVVGVVLVALGTGPVEGIGAGVLAAALYSFAVLGNDDVSDASLLTFSMVIRLVTYTGVGYLIGFFAAQHRALAEHLRILADRDRFSGLPTSRPFEVELTQRLEDGAPFALLLGEIDDLGNRADADEILLRLPGVLGQALLPGDAIARVGQDEFAIIAACRSSAEAAAIAGVVEEAFTARDLAVTFGWTVFPEEGRNGLALYRAANERLYARKMIRSPRAVSTA